MNPYSLFKFLAFQFDPEFVHDLSMGSFSRFANSLSIFFDQSDLNDRYLLDVSSMQWKFPIGLAAGLDKNAQAIDFFSKLYFGAIEVGTVTPLPQSGNPRPRLFRYPKEESLRNCMGFNNGGMDTLFENLKSTADRSRPIGVNLGKNKITSAKDAPSDYAKLFKKFSPVADYLVINVSSPNTPGLRDLQSESALREIFDEVCKYKNEMTPPLFLKLAPDLSDDGILEAVNIAKEYSLDGIVATNTTIMKERGAGGISGKLLYKKAKLVRKKVLDQLKETPNMSLIGVGGFSSFDEIFDYWKDGGRAVQIYSSFIFQGPKILSDIKLSLDKIFDFYQFNTMDDLFSNIESVNLEKVLWARI